MNIHYYLNVEFIKDKMQEQGLTEDMLAKKTGITKRRLCGYLNNGARRRVPFVIYYGLITALNVSFTDVITEKQ